MIIKFDGRIYSKKALLLTAQSFKDLARVIVMPDVKGHAVRVDVLEGDPEEIRREFCNYVLGMTHKCR
jgi:hypothetical protein